MIRSLLTAALLLGPLVPAPAPAASGGSHQGRLTPAELKLVSEWVDLGAQYFNDPFAAPLD